MNKKIKPFNDFGIWQKLFVLLILFSIFYSLFFLSTARAAQIFFETSKQEIAVNQQFEVTLKIDIQNQAINALEGEITFTDNLKLISVNDGDSFITLWIQRPTQKNNSVVFSGVIPGGYTGVFDPNLKQVRAGNIIRLIFAATKPGVAQIIFTNARVLLNDGQGTAAPLTVYNLQLNAVDKGITPQSGVIENKDTVPPESFTPAINRDPNVFNNQWFLIFKTRDDKSGIDHYEVKEQRQLNLFGLKINWFGQWIQAESPYPLKDQQLKSYIYVKAIDRAGNQTIGSLPPQKPLTWYENYSILFIIILIIIYLSGRLWWKKIFTR